MNLATFEDHLDRHGGDIGAWPQAARHEAMDLLSTSTAARRAHEVVREVERTFGSPLVAPGVAGEPVGAVDAMAAIAMRHPQQRPSRRLAAGFGWGAAAAAVLALGIAIGNVAPRPHDESPEHMMAAALDPAGSIDVD